MCSAQSAGRLEAVQDHFFAHRTSAQLRTRHQNIQAGSSAETPDTGQQNIFREMKACATLASFARAHLLDEVVLLARTEDQLMHPPTALRMPHAPSAVGSAPARSRRQVSSARQPRPRRNRMRDPSPHTNAPPVLPPALELSLAAPSGGMDLLDEPSGGMGLLVEPLGGMGSLRGHAQDFGTRAYSLGHRASAFTPSAHDPPEGYHRDSAARARMYPHVHGHDHPTVDAAVPSAHVLSQGTREYTQGTREYARGTQPGRVYARLEQSQASAPQAVCMCVRVFVNVFVEVYVCVSVFVNTCVWTCVCACTAYIWVCASVCVCACAHVYVGVNGTHTQRVTCTPCAHVSDSIRPNTLTDGCVCNGGARRFFIPGASCLRKYFVPVLSALCFVLTEVLISCFVLTAALCFVLRASCFLGVGVQEFAWESDGHVSFNDTDGDHDIEYAPPAITTAFGSTARNGTTTHTQEERYSIRNQHCAASPKRREKAALPMTASTTAFDSIANNSTRIAARQDLYGAQNQCNSDAASDVRQLPEHAAPSTLMGWNMEHRAEQDPTLVSVHIGSVRIDG